MTDELTDRMTAGSIPDRPVRVVQPSSSWGGYRLSDVWRHRELLYFLAWRDIKVRYRQTALGVAWAVLQPVALMALFTLVFGRIAGLQDHTSGIPYSAFVLVGLVPWTFFSAAIGSSSQSVVVNVALVTKTAFPRFLIPLAAVGVALLDFLIAFAVLLALLLAYGIVPDERIALLPFLVVGVSAAAFGIGSLFAALAVSYRDFRYVVPFLLQLWLYTSPVIYPLSAVPREWAFLLLLNPLTGLIGGFRSSLLGEPFRWLEIGSSMLLAAAWLAIGTLYFRRVERDFADVI
jgi:lipopolysaccharide transport system permease protein